MMIPIEQNFVWIDFEFAARVSFQFALSAMEASKFENERKFEARNCPTVVNLRQVIASNRGKGLVQVTFNLMVPIASGNLLLVSRTVAERFVSGE